MKICIVFIVQYTISQILQYLFVNDKPKAQDTVYITQLLYFFFQICESKFLGTLSSLDQFVLKQVKIQGHTELTCEAQFYHHLAVQL